jgi:nucleoside-diphosphate-sugar epimerase
MNILIAGGAGFIGSHIAERLLFSGHEVVILDGMLAETSGSPEMIAHLQGFRLIQESVESCHSLPELLDQTDIVIDCMGWTRHLLALKNPLYDLQLNVTSHLVLMRALKDSSCKRVIYLGSRGQIGNSAADQIDDDAPRHPVDVQGIHKTAAESHYRVFAKLNDTKILSLIIGNTFGPRMPMEGSDIGLVGGFFRDVLADRAIELYGKGRTREFTYTPDLAEIVSRLCQHDWVGFQSLNIPGTAMPLEELVQTLIEMAGTGSYNIEAWPAEVKAIDIGGARLCPAKIESWLGALPATPLREALQQTIRSIQARHA